MAARGSRHSAGVGLVAVKQLQCPSWKHFRNIHCDCVCGHFLEPRCRAGTSDAETPPLSDRRRGPDRESCPLRLSAPLPPGAVGPELCPASGGARGARHCPVVSLAGPGAQSLRHVASWGLSQACCPSPGPGAASRGARLVMRVVGGVGAGQGWEGGMSGWGGVGLVQITGPGGGMRARPLGPLFQGTVS